MSRVRIVHVVTSHATLICGHHVRIRAHGFYPAAAVCPSCPRPHTAWITTMQVTDGHTMIGSYELLPAVEVIPAAVPPAEPAMWLTYSVGVTTPMRHQQAVSCNEYVLNAATLTGAVVLAARACLGDHAETAEALVTIDDDGLPSFHVAWARYGVPVQPADIPGLIWTDLRSDTPIPAPARLSDVEPAAHPT